MGVGPNMDHGIGRVHPTERDGRYGISQVSRRNGAGTMSAPSTVPQTRDTFNGASNGASTVPQRCLKHKDEARQLTLRDFNLACEQWACESLREFTEEMEMWKWDLTLGNRWARVAKCSQLLNIPVEMSGDGNEERRGTSWARATRELRRLRHRIEAVGGNKDQWEAGVWHMDKEQWDLIWTGE
jgi:hypothetical protein